MRYFPPPPMNLGLYLESPITAIGFPMVVTHTFALYVNCEHSFAAPVQLLCLYARESVFGSL